MWLMYLPPGIYILWLVIRFRGLSFTAVNPALPGSGFIGEHKHHGLSLFNKANADFVARFSLIANSLSVERRIEAAQVYMLAEELDYPIVLKPDYGQRGLDVCVVRSEQELVDYLSGSSVDIIIQEHIAGLEFGVFYTRYPENDRGTVFSITEKHFPVLVGDGQSSLEHLILENPRTHYMARFLLDLHRPRLSMVLPLGEQFQTVEIGSHCRGSLFLDGCDKLTPALEARIDALCQEVPGFCFGRFDIRAESELGFVEGTAFKILEVNGVTSEATHIYDPQHSVFYAWRILCRQWRVAFEIGAQQRKLGHGGMNLLELLGKVRTMNS